MEHIGESIQDQAVLKLLDQALDDIQGALLRDEMPDLTAQNMLQTIRQRLSQNNEEDQNHSSFYSSYHSCLVY